MDKKFRDQIHSERMAGISAVQRLQAENERLRDVLACVVQWADADGDFINGPAVRRDVKTARAMLTPNANMTGLAPKKG